MNQPHGGGDTACCFLLAIVIWRYCFYISSSGSLTLCLVRRLIILFFFICTFCQVRPRFVTLYLAVRDPFQIPICARTAWDSIWESGSLWHWGYCSVSKTFKYFRSSWGEAFFFPRVTPLVSWTTICIEQDTEVKEKVQYCSCCWSPKSNSEKSARGRCSYQLSWAIWKSKIPSPLAVYHALISSPLSGCGPQGCGEFGLFFLISTPSIVGAWGRRRAARLIIHLSANGSILICTDCN